MAGSARIDDSFRMAVLLTVLLVLLCAACTRSTQESGKRSNDPEPITTQGGKKEDAAGAGGASVRRVEVSTLATDLEVPWSFAFLPGGDALVTERDSGRLLRVSRSGEVQEIQRLP